MCLKITHFFFAFLD